MGAKYSYVDNCVGGIGEEINNMKEKSKSITRETFLKYTGNIDEIEQGLGYSVRNQKGLHMSKDWHVSYDKSVYQDKSCVFFTWSAIEFIFVEEDSGERT